MLSRPLFDCQSLTLNVMIQVTVILLTLLGPGGGGGAHCAPPVMYLRMTCKYMYECAEKA